MLYLCPLSSILIGFLLRCSLTVARRRWWSLPTSAPLFTVTLWRQCFQRPFIKTWYIWFLTFPSGEIHVNLWISLCSKMVPPITRSFKPQISASLRSRSSHHIHFFPWSFPFLRWNVLLCRLDLQSLAEHRVRAHYLVLLQLLIKCVICLLLSIIGWGVALYNW